MCIKSMNAQSVTIGDFNRLNNLAAQLRLQNSTWLWCSMVQVYFVNAFFIFRAIAIYVISVPQTVNFC